MSTSLRLLDMSLPIHSLDAYIQKVNQIPMLTKEEEYDYACRLQKENDLESARALIMAHLRYVVRVARSYSGYGLAVGDLIQEGNVGLMKAVKRFDPEMGVRLVSFAVHWIKAEIHEFILRNWRIVKVATTKAQRKLFFNLRSAKKRLGWFSQEEIKSVAADLGVTTKEVETMESRLNAQDAAFDGYTDDDGEATTVAPMHYLEDKTYNPETMLEHQDWAQQAQKQLSQAIEALDDRSRDIIQKRWLTEDKATLHELAYTYNVSAERVRQLEKNALQKLQRQIQIH